MKKRNRRLHVALALVFASVWIGNSPSAFAMDASTNLSVSNLVWCDARQFGIEGRGWDDTRDFYDRLPARAEALVRKPVWDLSRNSAGMCVRFVTDATSLRARWVLTESWLYLPNMTAIGKSGLDLYVKTPDGWRWLAVGVPTGQTNDVKLVDNLLPGKREYLLYLPLYNGTKSLSLGIATNAVIEKAPSWGKGGRKPIVFYGTSILQGASASRPGMVHSAILQRKFNWPVINLGFSGNGKMEPEIADLLAELDPSIYVIDCLPNMVADEITQRAGPLVRKLRAAHPQTPIVLVEDRTMQDSYLIAGRMEYYHLKDRAALRKVYETLQKEGVKDLHYIPGDHLLGDDGEGTTDGSHPNDLGFMRQAKIFAEVLEPLIKKTPDDGSPMNQATHQSSPVISKSKKGALFSAHDEKVEALLAQMTLDEKIGQMTQPDSGALKDKGDVAKYFLGSVLSGGNSDPDQGNTAKDWLTFVDSFKKPALETRLKIPLLYGIDAVHGNNNIDGATIFPHNLGLGATHDPHLVELAAHCTAKETAGTGVRWAFSPCVTVPQNESWGRTYEGFGDDPVLVSKLGIAMVDGLQGKKLSADPLSVLACAKHFVGDGGTSGGVDQGDTVCDEARLRKVYLPPYRAAIKAGVGSIMVSFSSWNGLKMHANKYLLTDVLKGELGFRGFLVSDWAAIDQISPDYKHDIEQSINAGLDMIMIPFGPDKPNNYVEFINKFKELVAEGKIPMSRVDDAVRRILRIKFQMGLFDGDTTDPALTAGVGSPEHRALARECVRKSLVLLKNENHLLPLSKNVRCVAVVGPGADDLGMQCGGWTIDWQGSHGQVTQGGTTLLAAIRRAVSPATKIIVSTNGTDLNGAEVVVVVIGETPYAEMKGDRADLTLSAQDRDLIAKAKATGAKVVTILFSGRSLILRSALDDSNAFIAAWLPGTEGTGISDVLFGDFRFTGKLPRKWLGETPDHPLFPRGFGITTHTGL